MKYFKLLILLIFILNGSVANAQSIEKCLTAKSNCQGFTKGAKYDALLIRQINKKSQGKTLKYNNVNIETMLYRKAQEIMKRDSHTIEMLLNKNKHNILINTPFIQPLAGKITSSFGFRVHPVFRETIFHSGIDIAAPLNSPVMAANAGKVIYTGKKEGYGNVVIIDHGISNGERLSSVYGHLSQILVLKDQAVKAEQTIGIEGSTGISTGSHLHFEIRKNGKPVNPVAYIKMPSGQNH